MAEAVVKQRGLYQPLIAVLAIAGVGILAAWSPVSPLALDAGDLALGHGHPAAALEHYDRVALNTPFATVEKAALERAARVASVDLDNAEEARIRLRRLARAFPEEAAQAYERIGDLRLHSERRPALAAEAYVRAFDAETDAVEAPDRLMKAARARGEANQMALSRGLWQRVATEFPEARVPALLGLAEAQLAGGDAQAALSTYEEAELLTGDPTLSSYAALGAAACLERLGNLDGALAELDLADLPEDVFVSRRQALMERQADTW